MFYYKENTYYYQKKKNPKEATYLNKELVIHLESYANKTYF